MYTLHDVWDFPPVVCTRPIIINLLHHQLKTNKIITGVQKKAVKTDTTDNLFTACISFLSSAESRWNLTFMCDDQNNHWQSTFAIFSMVHLSTIFLYNSKISPPSICSYTLFGAFRLQYFFGEKNG